MSEKKSDLISTPSHFILLHFIHYQGMDMKLSCLFTCLLSVPWTRLQNLHEDWDYVSVVEKELGKKWLLEGAVGLGLMPRHSSQGKNVVDDSTIQ